MTVSCQQVAVAGQPNVGKSTIFNLLTGLRQEVGNWAGKTVEKKSGYAPREQGGYMVVDLPGSYSLSFSSPEERIACEYILTESPSLVVVVVNAASLERTLYYALDIMLLSVPCLIALNMVDVAEKNGVSVNPAALSHALGTPVTALMGSKEQGADDLRSIIKQALATPPAPVNVYPALLQHLPQPAAELHAKWTTLLQRHAHWLSAPAEWTAWKALEQDDNAMQVVTDACRAEGIAPPVFSRKLQDAAQQAKFDWIEQTTQRDSACSLSHKSPTAVWDKWLLHPVLGPVLMMTILLTAIIVGFSLGSPLGLGLWRGLQIVETAVLDAIPPELMVFKALTKGGFRGVGAVLSMLPFVAVFYAIFAILEDVGYMSRAAFLMDSLMTRLGLNGKAFVPLLFALPCNIPGVMACRTVDSARQRLLLFLLIPLIPCSAKLVVLSTLAAWLFPPFWAVSMVLLLLIMNFSVLMVSCVVFDRFLPGRDDYRGLIMELPHYHRPNVKNIFRSILSNTNAFLKKAATLMVSFSILVWFVSYYPTGQVETSWLGQLGHMLEPVASVMGADWRLLTSLFTSAISKEATLATMGVIYNVPLVDLPDVLRNSTSLQGALAFMCAQSLFIPCVATLGMIYKETRSLKIFFFIILYTLLLPFAAAIVVYQTANALLG
ncbi:ferrous iron transport protein B [Desulfovibrio desulfuricans]|uniref:ferrous iron transport protein B n=1 Tax=Desulfovibrio desulfuricans TaxID=876 RepID=UPI001F218220|nr:ferrous iron transport protein B [Desulfovibrio desulfuricans]UIA98845.1 ferrous iron transport protein B [Desulfovibrio desulfuricans]